MPNNLATNRRCRVCGETKSVNAFAQFANTKNRRHTTCTPCFESAREARRAVVPVAARNGLHHSRYETLYRQQNGRCAICYQPEHVREPDGTVRALVVYAYQTNDRTVFALLCYRCNHGMDGFASSPTLLTRALDLLLAGQSTDTARLAFHAR